jgi:hypothetical protein
VLLLVFGVYDFVASVRVLSRIGSWQLVTQTRHLHWSIRDAPDGTMGQPNTGVQTNFFYQVGNERLDYTQLKPRGVSAAGVCHIVCVCCLFVRLLLRMGA